MHNHILPHLHNHAHVIATDLLPLILVRFQINLNPSYLQPFPIVRINLSKRPPASNGQKVYLFGLVANSNPPAQQPRIIKSTSRHQSLSLLFSFWDLGDRPSLY
jgi:hypothetical protein